MPAGTLVERLGQPRRGMLIPPGHWQAEQPDAKVWAVFSHLQAAEWLHVMPHRAIFITKGSREGFSLHLFGF